MNDGFGPVSAGAPARRSGGLSKGIADVRALADRVAGVIRALRPDALTVQEGPSRIGEMRLFVDDHLDGAFDVPGPSGGGQPRLCKRVRKGGAIAKAERVRPSDGEIDSGASWPVGIAGDLIVGSCAFARAPLVTAIEAAGRRGLLMNVRSKSRYIDGGRPLWENQATRPQFIARAVRNRRRIAAELLRVRQWMDQATTAAPEARTVVAGDLKSDPGTEFFEERDLINNVVAVVSGGSFHPRRMLRRAFIDRELRDRNLTARFDDFIDGVSDRPLLLDHILLSPTLDWGALRTARIEHEAWEAAVRSGSGRESRPSDHRPQSAMLAFG